jgi:molecular chaperone GrpE
MTKMDDAQKRAKKILEEVEKNQAKYHAQTEAKPATETETKSDSHTEVNIENHSEQAINGQTVTSEDEVFTGDQPAPSDQSDESERAAELTRDLQRLQAEFANYKRRTDGEKSEVAAFVTARVVREFLATRDSFDQEKAHRPKDIDPKWAASIDAVRAQFDKSLSNLGVERFESVGHPFDPHLHEAISMEGGDEVVTEELQAGYKMGDTILRHAMVKVGPAETKE